MISDVFQNLKPYIFFSFLFTMACQIGILWGRTTSTWCSRRTVLGTRVGKPWFSSIRRFSADTWAPSHSWWDFCCCCYCFCFLIVIVILLLCFRCLSLFTLDVRVQLKPGAYSHYRSSLQTPHASPVPHATLYTKYFLLLTSHTYTICTCGRLSLFFIFLNRWAGAAKKRKRKCRGDMSSANTPRSTVCTSVRISPLKILPWVKIMIIVITLVNHTHCCCFWAWPVGS